MILFHYRHSILTNLILLSKWEEQNVRLRLEICLASCFFNPMMWVVSEKVESLIFSQAMLLHVRITMFEIFKGRWVDVAFDVKMLVDNGKKITLDVTFGWEKRLMMRMGMGKDYWYKCLDCGHEWDESCFVSMFIMIVNNYSIILCRMMWCSVADDDPPLFVPTIEPNNNEQPKLWLLSIELVMEISTIFSTNAFHCLVLLTSQLLMMMLMTNQRYYEEEKRIIQY